MNKTTFLSSLRNCDISGPAPYWIDVLSKYEGLIFSTIEQYNFGRTLLYEDILSEFIVKLIKLDQKSIERMYNNYNYTETSLTNFCKTIYKKEKIRRDPDIILKIARAGRILGARTEYDLINEIQIDVPIYLDFLTAKEKAVTLLWRKGLPHEEIAKELNISINTSKKRLERAKKRIARHLT